MRRYARGFTGEFETVPETLLTTTPDEQTNHSTQSPDRINLKLYRATDCLQGMNQCGCLPIRVHCESSPEYDNPKTRDHPRQDTTRKELKDPDIKEQVPFTDCANIPPPSIILRKRISQCLDVSTSVTTKRCWVRHKYWRVDPLILMSDPVPLLMVHPERRRPCQTIWELPTMREEFQLRDFSSSSSSSSSSLRSLTAPQIPGCVKQEE